jgi:hypothetical protein
MLCGTSTRPTMTNGLWVTRAKRVTVDDDKPQPHLMPGVSQLMFVDLAELMKDEVVFRNSTTTGRRYGRSGRPNLPANATRQS